MVRSDSGHKPYSQTRPPVIYKDTTVIWRSRAEFWEDRQHYWHPPNKIKLLPLFQNIRHSRFTKICLDHKYLSNTINTNYKNYIVGFVLKNTIIILFLKNFYQHKLRIFNGESSTSNIVRALYCETEGVVISSGLCPVSENFHLLILYFDMISLNTIWSSG